ncbi:MAG: HAD family hydrolase [Balneolaceae bacterium]
MNLIVFDIDGTLIDSVKIDDKCFIQTFQLLHKIDLENADWNNFKNVTDSGLTNEIFENHYGRLPTESEVNKVKDIFYSLLKQRDHEMSEIIGANTALRSLINHPEFTVAFATGGWKETALLKLSAIGFDIGELTLVSANDFTKRSEITNLAISRSLAKTGLREFSTITYVGDGLWDWKTTNELGINFIGIDYHNTNKLKQAGAVQILNDLNNLDLIISWAKGHT